MALLFMDGFEGGDHLLRYVTAGQNISFSSTGTRFGLGRYITASAAGVILSRALSAPVTRVITGFAYYPIISVDSNNILELLADGGAVLHIAVRHMANNALALYRGTTQVAITAANVMPQNVWHYLEVSATLNDTTGNARVHLNGIEVLNFTGDTRNAGTSTLPDTVNLRNATASQNRWDDWYICDDTGSAPANDFLGDSRVVALTPSGAGANTNLTPSTAPNWSCVDELPYVATDYVVSGTVGARDTYAMADLPAGVTTVYGVQVNSIAKKTDSGTRSVKHVVRSGGTDYPDGAAQALAVSDAWYRSLRVTDPATSAAWTLSGVNSMEAGVEVA